MKKLIIAFALFLSTLVSSAQCTAVDNFVTNGNLGLPNLAQSTATSVVNGATQAVATFAPLSAASGVVSPNAIFNLGSVTWIGSSCTLPNDQYSQIVLNGGVQYAGYTGPTVRMDGNGNGYVWSISGATILKLIDYNFSLTVAEYCPGPINGDTYQLVMRGSVITGYEINPSGTVVQTCQGADAAYTTGKIGFMVDQSLWRGPWNSTTTYNTRQIVSVGTELYYANQSNTTNVYPPDNLGTGGWTDEGQTPTNIDAVSKFQGGYSTLVPPTFSYATGVYGFSPIIKFHDDNSGVTMCYTTDGTTPTATVPGICSNGTSVTEGGTFTVTSTMNLQAIATKTLLANSTVTSTIYTIRSGASQSWYVRPDGGTRFSTNTTTGQCDGLADVSYVSTGALTNAKWQANFAYHTGDIIIDLPGFYETAASNFTSGSNVLGPSWGSSSTTDNTGSWTKGAAVPKNQHCAFNDFRMLFDDGSNKVYASPFPAWGWVGAGGDTYIVRGSVADGIWYSVGWNNLTSPYCDSTGCWGVQEGSRMSGTLSLYSGDPTHITRLLGGNYLNCESASLQETRPTPNATQLRGRWNDGGVYNMGSSQYTDTECFDITDNSNCGMAADTIPCRDGGSNPIADFAYNGIQMDPTTTNVSMNHIRIHGIGGQGISGNPGPGFTATDFAIIGNPGAGWNADDGTGKAGFGSMLIQHFDISWNGCVEELPLVDVLPYFSCTDASSGGYGDGFGTSTVESPPGGWQVHFDDGVASYNTQDGLDALHISGIGSTMTDTRVLAFGNEGQQLKVGGAQATIQNSVIVGNCEALVLGSKNPGAIFNYPQWTSQPPIVGTPLGFGDLLAAPCRAGNTAALVNITPGDPGIFQDNTLFSAGAIGLEVEYATYDTGPTNTLAYNNNVFVGFNNGVDFASVMFSNIDLNMLTNPGASFTNNATYHQKVNFPCPNTGLGETNAICSDPQLVDMTYHSSGYGEMVPTANSPLLRAGVAVTGITVDYLGVTRTNPPTIGAYDNPPVLNTITVTPASASQVITLTESYSAFCAYSDGFTNPCTVTWTGTGNHSTVQTVTGPVTSVLVNSVGTDTITATISTVFGTATITGLPIPIFNPFRGAHLLGSFN